MWLTGVLLALYTASAVHAHRVLRLPSNWSSARPSIIGRGGEFFVRYGDKEREAVAYFDFLNDIPLSVAPQQHHQFNGCGSSCGQAVPPNPTEHGSLLVDLAESARGTPIAQ